MTDARPTVVVADGQDFIRAGARTVLERAGFEICAEANDAAGAIAAVRRERPRLCLLDVHLAGGGIEAARAITRLSPQTTVIMLTASAAEEDVIAAFRAGASGYLLKGAPIESLPRSLHAALRGEAPLSRSLVGLLVDHVGRSRTRHVMLTTGDILQLTHREWDVAQLLRDGRSTREIADALSISPITVRRHVSEIRAKLGASNRASAADLLSRSFA